jgi:PTS system nitrogen regulatory IIA component
MEIADLVTPASVIANLRAANKRQALQELAKRGAALTGRHERAIFEVLLERERLNTTGLGNGTALARISRLLRDKAMCDKLRGTDRSDALYALLSDRSASHAA